MIVKGSFHYLLCFNVFRVNAFFEKKKTFDAPIISHVFSPNTFFFGRACHTKLSHCVNPKVCALGDEKIIQVDNGPPFMIFGAIHDNNNINHAKA